MELFTVTKRITFGLIMNTLVAVWSLLEDSRRSEIFWLAQHGSRTVTD